MTVRRDPIVIRTYDAAWATAFREQAQAIEDALPGWLTAPIEHIGSTAVPGLPAKPIIDMLAIIPDYDRFAAAVARLERIGWVHAPEPADRERRRWSLCFPDAAHRTHHLHVVEHDSDGWRDWLLFRDFLRTHPDAAARYAACKQRLAKADSDDRAAYRAGKAPLITELMDQARRWSAAG